MGDLVMETKELKLPPSVIGQIDISRMIRELTSLNDFFIDANRRTAGTPVQPPRLSRLLDQLAKANDYNLLEPSHRQGLIGELEALLRKAPLLHISFAAEPSPKALERILLWLRQNIDHQTLLTVGIQPSIAAGCVLRTPNRWFDMSMRQYLRQQEPYLAQLIEEAANGR
jgi:hypothetical protein